MKGKVELKVVSQEKSEVEEDGHKKSKVKVENRIGVRWKLRVRRRTN